MGKIVITDNSIVGVIYTIILAAIITLFIGITVNTFYPAPKYPETKPFASEEGKTELSAEDKKIEVENERLQKEYDLKQKEWAQTASIIVIVAATALVALGLFMVGKMPIIPNGVLLGGLFTIFMGIIFSMMTESRYLIFGVVTTSLIIITGAGYWRFVHHEDK